MANDIKFEIEKNLGILSESRKGWKKELNLITWGEAKAKYDLREWSPDHDRMSKGVTLSKEELTKLKALLNTMDI